MQQLRTVIDAKGRAFGSTDNGKAWCIKALHPSDPVVEVNGIPDKSAVPSVFMNYQATYTLGTARADTNPWSFDAALVPNPVGPLWATTNDGTNDHVTTYLNPQLAGEDFNAKFQSFLEMAERWRLAYMSVTVYQDGPSLADQGTISACQVPTSFAQTCTAPQDCAMLLDGGNPTRVMLTPTIAIVDASDWPSFERCQAMPNSYFAKSKEGCYLPLKLTKTCQQWHSIADSTMWAPRELNMPNPDAYNGEVGLVNAGGSTMPISDDASFVRPGAYFPYGTNHGTAGVGAGAEPAWRLRAGPTEVYKAFVATRGSLVPHLMNDNVGHICVRNAASTTSFSFFVRMGIEMQVQPSSPLAPQMRISPAYDRDALETYFAIARELKDAYPADFNDLGKIWNAIKGAARFALPAAKMLPGIGPVISAMEGPVGALLQDVERKVSTPRDKPPAAAVQRARDSMKVDLLTARKKIARKGVKSRK